MISEKKRFYVLNWNKKLVTNFFSSNYLIYVKFNRRISVHIIKEVQVIFNYLKKITLQKNFFKCNKNELVDDNNLNKKKL